jgi:hypothetical protein
VHCTAPRRRTGVVPAEGVRRRLDLVRAMRADRLIINNSNRLRLHIKLSSPVLDREKINFILRKKKASRVGECISRLSQHSNTAAQISVLRKVGATLSAQCFTLTWWARIAPRYDGVAFANSSIAYDASRDLLSTAQ